MFLTYFVLWIIFNGRFTLEIGLFGLAIAGALLAFSCKFVDYSLAKELRVYKNIFLFQDSPGGQRVRDSDRHDSILLGENLFYILRVS